MEHPAKKLINWASILEPNTREQALRTASMPFIWPHLALMCRCPGGAAACRACSAGLHRLAWRPADYCRTEGAARRCA